MRLTIPAERADRAAGAAGRRPCWSETLPRWLAGEIAPQPQDASLATVCRPLRKEQGVIDWTRPADEIVRAVRAFNPWPAASTTWQGQQIKLLRASALTGAAGQAPGVVALVDGAVLVAAGEGVVRLAEVQLAGRAALPAQRFRSRPARLHRQPARPTIHLTPLTVNGERLTVNRSPLPIP
ncbi:MAG: hypothetical protein V9H69_03225 [Anaerolineae bacterium]